MRKRHSCENCGRETTGFILCKDCYRSQGAANKSEYDREYAEAEEGLGLDAVSREEEIDQEVADALEEEME